MASDGSFYYAIQGIAEGTSYNIVYLDEKGRDFQSDIEILLADFEKSLSVYDPASIISRINNNENIETDLYFNTIFQKAKHISSITEGAFDISAEPLFRAWGFSFQEKDIPDDDQIKSLKEIIGMDKVRLENNRIIKSNPNVILNANAIAKGYSADITASFLEEKGCTDFLVEIGGEIKVKGKNPDGEAWWIGVDRPAENNPIPGQELQVILKITDKGIATSGNYRQFYIENGQKITHTINPATGYPVKHNLLSVTVITNDAMTSDALATAFLVAGIEKSLEWAEKIPELEALFICDEKDEYKVYYTPGLEDYIVPE